MARVQIEGILQLVDVDINPAIFTKISQAVAGIQRQANKLPGAFSQTNQHAQNLNRTFTQTRSNLSSMDRLARQFVQRMAQFAILLPTFATLNKSIQGGVKFLADFEQGLKNILRVDIQNLSGRLDEVAKGVLEISTTIGGTAEEVLDTVKIFVQAGLSLEEAMDRAKVATLATKTTTLDLAQAQEVLIAVNEQFKGLVGSNTEILDKFAKVEDISAVNAQDLAEGLRTGGNSLAFFTKNLDDTVALLAAVRQQTRKSGNEIGTFFKTLITRISAAGEAQDAIKGLGIEVVNLDGSLRNGMDILIDLKAAFDGLTESEQANAAKSIAGVRQFESLLGVLKSLDNAVKFSAASQNSAGTIAEKYAVVQDSLSNIAERTVNKFKALAFVLGENGLLDVFKQAVEFAGNLATGLTAVAKAADSAGISLAPLLAVGGALLAKKTFGLGGGANLGGGTGSASRINPNATLQSQGAVPLKQATQQNILNAQLVQSTKSLALLTAAAIGTQAVFNGLNKITTSLSDNTRGAIDDVGNALTVGLQLAVLNPIAGKVGGAVTLFITAINRIGKAVDDEIKARKELVDLNKQEKGRQFALDVSGLDPIFSQAAVELGKALNGNGQFTDEAKKAGDSAFKALVNALPAEDDLQKQIKDRLGAVNFSDILFDVEGMKNIASQLPGLQRTNEFIAQAGENLKNLGPEFRQIFFEDLAQFAQVLESTGTAFEDFFAKTERIEALELLLGAEEKLRDVRIKLAESVGEGIPLFQSELEVMKRRLELEKAAPSIIQKQIDLLREQAEAAPGSLGFGTAGSALGFIDQLERLAESGMTTDEALKSLATTIADNEKRSNTAKQALQLLGARMEEHADITDLSNNVLRRQIEAEAELNKIRNDSFQNLEDSLNELRASAFDLGATSVVTADEIDRLKNLSFEDYKAILNGTANVTENIRNIIGSFSDDEVKKAQSDLAGTQAKIGFTTEILTEKIKKLNDRLAALTGDVEQGTGTARVDIEKERADLQDKLNKELLSGELDVVKSRQKLNEALKKSEEEAAKKAKELAEALDKVARAERNFLDGLNESEREFQKFADDKRAESAKNLADAQKELGDAEKEVINANDELTKAYNELITSVYEYNDAIADAMTQNNLLAIEIESLGGGLNDFQGRLAAINNAFTEVLDESNISLQKRIDLERQLAEETISYLQQVRDEIVSAGLNIFGQSGAENRELGVGIEGLRLVAEKLGGSFEAFQNIGPQQFEEISKELLNLPLSLRQNILEALQTLPSTTNIGGFSPEQLEQAIGQIGAGISPEEGLPSIEELLNKEAEQLAIIQDLNMRQAELQITEVAAALEQVTIAQAALDEAEVARVKAEEQLSEIQSAILEENAILEKTDQLRIELTDKIIAASNLDTIEQIRAQAEEFASLKDVSLDIGDKLVDVVDAISDLKIQVITATSAVPSAAHGYIPNYARGKLTPGEIGGLLNAARREKAAMPAGAGLAVANTSETIIPNRAAGFIPNFQDGSAVAAGIDAVRSSNAAIIAAISRSIANVQSNRNTAGPQPIDPKVIDALTAIEDRLETLSTSLTSIDDKTVTPGSTTQTAAAAQTINVNVSSNNRDTIQLTGIDRIGDELVNRLQQVGADQARRAVLPIIQQLQTLIGAGIENGQLTGLGQGRA